VLQNSVIALNL